MFKPPSFWPQRRRLFRDKAARSMTATTMVVLLSVAAALLLISVLRQPGG